MDTAKPTNHADGLPFRDLVQYLLQPLQDYSRRSGIKGRSGVIAPTELKRVAISKFIVRWRREVGDDVFPLFRLLMPERDKERSMYKIKEANMAKLFIKILGISPASEDAISIEKWKIPGARGAAGDFPGRLYEVLRTRAAVSDWGNMTIDEVNEGLDQLSRCSKESQQRPILTNFYNHMSALELRWLCCIILRTMKIGASERTIFDLWHPDAHKLFNKSSSLARVCWELFDSDYRLPDAEKDISVFSCFQPQLAGFKRADIADVVRKMGDKTFYIEEKLDGERIQLHKSGSTFKYWSRKAKDYTYLYGASYGDESNTEGGGLTKYLTTAFDPAVQTVVLDGEMITWNDKFDAPVGFGSLKSAANAEKNNTTNSFEGHPFFCVFDILYLNGSSLTGYSLRDRREALKGIIRPVTRRIEVVPVQEATKEFEVEARLRECIANASEGLVVKDPDSPYRPNDRNDSWIKVKPEYMEEFGENLDLLVIGAYYGEGRRGNRLANFLCGLREDNPDGDSPIPKFKTFARVGGGFNGPDYARIDHLTEGKWHKFDSKNPPSQFYTFGRGRNGTICDPPDKWITPQDSFVVQLKAASSTASDTFATHVTLRFPRFECLREDKDWETATSLTDFINIQAQAVTEHEEKIMKAHVRRKQNPRVKKKVMTIQGAGEHDNRGTQTSNIFQDMEFYVLTECKAPKVSKIELENKIKAHGGNIVHHEGTTKTSSQLPKKETRIQKRKREESEALSHNDASHREVHIIGERNVVKVASLIKRGVYDILRPQWILESIAQRRLLHKEPRYMYFSTPDTAMHIAESVDVFGDSFTNHVTVESLTELLENMRDLDTPTQSALSDLRDALLEMGDLPMWMFARFTGYFDHLALSHRNHLSGNGDDVNVGPGQGMSEIEDLWRDYGGAVTTDVHDPTITHVLIDTQDTARVKSIRSILSMRQKVPRVVKLDWVGDSVHAATVLNEERYTLPR